MRILVTGGTGYTGHHTVTALLAAGHSVRCLVRSSSDTSRLPALGVEWATGDLTRPSSVVPALEGADAAVCASHIRFARGMAEACGRAGVSRALFFSSTWRFSKVTTPETRAVEEGEATVEDSGLEATLLRPTMIYGPGDDRNISRLRDHLRTSHFFPVFGSGERMVQPVYVQDVASAAAAAIGSPSTIRKAYEIAGRDAMPYRQMVDTVSAAVGRRVVKVYVPMAIGLPMVRLYGKLSRSPRVTVDQVRRMNEDRAFDTTAAQEDLGFSPRGFAEGLREAMRANGEAIDPTWERSF